ncbi:hypothetical protein DEO72_LG5g2081 [Vigna unguiculata]|uniref:Uncharacterized protein n=1 Tax=Vigna unguiculata TaxID=3917 RepID=A0A4D6LZT6_VIGUN|nr:hypothetical protein DEO72_LG5g2081 [Vigna unguiculata]
MGSGNNNNILWTFNTIHMAYGDLNTKFGTLIWSKHINQVVLSGLTSVVVCKLLISDSPKSTKIGKG